MAITDLTGFSPDAQRQIAEQLGRTGRKPGKYHNKPAERTMPNGTVHTFPSQREARRYDQLALLLQAGRIRGLKLQPEFTLQESYIASNGTRVRAIRYVADFSYERMEVKRYQQDGGCTFEEVTEYVYVVEDAKGKRTKEYAMKKKMMAEKYGIIVREV